MTRFATLIHHAMRKRGISAKQLSNMTGLTLAFLSSDDLTLTPNDEEKIRLCEALNLNQDYILNLPLTFGEGTIIMIRKGPLTPEMERMVEISFDAAYGIADELSCDEIC